MSSSDDFRKPAPPLLRLTPQLPQIVLVTKGSHVPSFKNNKMLCRGRLITDPKKQQWMKECVRSFMSQLCSTIQIKEGETPTAQQARSLIALLPADDNWMIIPETNIRGEATKKGLEGCKVTITKL